MRKTWPLCFLSFAAGIALAYYSAWPLFIIVMILAFLAASWYQDYRLQIILTMILLVAGMGNYQLRTADSPVDLPTSKAVQISGKIQDIPYYDGQKTSYTLQTADPSPYSQHIRVVCLFKANFSRGDFVKLNGDLKPPAEPGNPGQFDYPAYLAQQGIYYNLTVKQPSQATLIIPESGPLQWIDVFRHQAEELTLQTLPPQEASVLLGMLLGGRAGMEEEQYTDFQKTGIVHLFSVGGLHVSFLLLLVVWMCSLAHLSTRSKLWAGVAILLIYGTMVGWPAPVIRAVLMGIIGLLAYYSGRDNGLPNSLAISGLVILILDPGLLFNLSFQLTFLATWGLVYFFPLLRDNFPHQGWGWDIVLIPISVEMAVLPLVAYHFNLFTPISILTNILITYLAGGAVILGFIAFLLAAVLPALAALMLYPAGLCIEIILWIVREVKLVPGGYLWVATPAMAMMGIYFLGLLVLVLALRRTSLHRYRLPALLLLVIFFISLLVPAGWYNRGSLELVFIDVGQGDAILIKSPQGKFILIDGGGSQFYDVGAKTVLPYLHHRGIRQLDMIINTHPDIDHLLGLERVAEQMPARYLGLPASIINCPEFAQIKNTAQTQKSEVIPLRAGQTINLEEGLEIRVLYPQLEAYNGDQYNQESVVLQVKYHDFAALLSGDIPTAVMPAVAQAADTPNVLVKVPHHGSKGSISEEFYRLLQPRYAVISVAANNPFGHPAPEVLKMLEEEGIGIWRTDQVGAVVVRSDGREFTVGGTKVEN